MTNLQVAGSSIDLEDGKRVIAGYAFGRRLSDAWEPHGSTPYGDEPASRKPPRWAYRSYDCVPATSGPMTVQDILVANGINADMDATSVLATTLVLDDLSEALVRIPEGWRFWDEGDYSSPAESSEAWWMTRAWWLLMSVADVGVARTHKILHHKRPAVFPLIDRKTVGSLTSDSNGAWNAILQDLNTSEAAYEEMERWFADLAAMENGVPLTRLRLHDILLWCQETQGKCGEAWEAGSAYLDSRSG